MKQGLIRPLNDHRVKFKGITLIFCNCLYEYVYANWFQCRHCGQWKQGW